jgi:ATPase subunit of ABC transporter with duplicated ATPase domains
MPSSGHHDHPTDDSIEALTRRYQELEKTRMQADVALEHATARLEELKAEARETYNTDDLEELQKRLEEMEADNARKRAEYLAALEKIESGLQKLEGTEGKDDDES